MMKIKPKENIACSLIAIEKYLINKGTNVSNKKLQILLYFSQAWFIIKLWKRIPVNLFMG